MRNIYSLAAFMTLVAAAAAQPIGVTPTLTGFLHDNGARALRPIVGIPGSAFIGHAVVNDLDAAWPSPGNDAAIAIRGEETLLITGLRSPEPLQHDMRFLAHPSNVIWNSAGNVAAILAADGKSIQRVMLRRDGVLADPVEPLTYLGSIGEIAISSSGHVALATAEGIHVLRSGSAPELVVNRPALSLTFYADDRLYASTEDSLLQIHLGSNSIESAATETRIAVLRAAPKANGLFGIDAASRKVFVFNLDGSVRSELSLDDVPLTLTPLQDNSVFVLNGIEETKPVMVLKASLDPSFYFVPAEKLNVP
jgi:hypothetical protein